MGKKFLIDTNVLLGFIGKILPEKGHETISKIVDTDFNISFINKIEILGHSSSTKELEEFVNTANILELSEPIIDTTINLRRSYKIKLPDALIAATALTKKLIVETRNTSDFKKINHLEIMNPWTL